MEIKDKYALWIALVGCIIGLISLSWQITEYYGSRYEKVSVGYSYLAWSEDTVCISLDVVNNGRKPVYLDEVILKFGSENRGLIWNPSSIILYTNSLRAISGLEVIEPGNIKRFFYSALLPATEVDLNEMYKNSKKNFVKGWSKPKPFIVVVTSKERHVFDKVTLDLVMTAIKNREKIKKANKRVQGIAFRYAPSNP